MQGSRPLLILGLAGLLLAASAAAAGGSYSGRVVVISHPAARGSGAAACVNMAAAAAAAEALMRRLEDEVAPELLSSLLPGRLGAGNNDRGHRAVEQADRAACKKECPAPGEPYTRPCTYKERCPQ